MKENSEAFKLSGFLITYNSSNRKDITKINHYLFGRIVKIKKDDETEEYYYPGLFENNPFKKISNGCYFVGSVGTDFNGLLKVTPAIVTFSDKEMVTAKEYWKERTNNKIHNW